jgi:predicted GNAT family N-acyltransferase
VSDRPDPSFRIESLKSSHDRAAFQCGVSELDDYLQQQAGQDTRRKVAAPFVLRDPKGSIAGYSTLSAYSVRPGELPQSVGKKLPRYPQLPATLVGRLAVSREQRGRNLGRLLLMDALHRRWKNTAEVASVGVVVEALDDSARAFYRHHEFIPLVDHANKLFLAMATIERAFKTL